MVDGNLITSRTPGDLPAFCRELVKALEAAGNEAAKLKDEYVSTEHLLLSRVDEKTGEAAKILQGLPIDFHSTSRALADTAADFKARFKISLADAFAAALAKEKKAELVTGDPEFKLLEKEIKINWLK